MYGTLGLNPIVIVFSFSFIGIGILLGYVVFHKLQYRFGVLSSRILYLEMIAQRAGLHLDPWEEEIYTSTKRDYKQKGNVVYLEMKE